MCRNLFRDIVVAVAAMALLASAARADEPKPPPAAQDKPWQLADVYAWADKLLKRLDGIESYTATIAARERLDDGVNGYKRIYLKFRRKPKSFYMYFLGPQPIQGRQVLYAENLNAGRTLLHEGNRARAQRELFSLPPNEIKPATSGYVWRPEVLNMRDLTKGFVQFLKKHDGNGAWQVRRYPGAKINGRLCTMIEVDHRTGNRRFVMHVFADDKLHVPNRFELLTSDPKQNKLELLEEYTFLNVKLDPPLTDRDFDLNNPDYRFVEHSAGDEASKARDNATPAPATEKAPQPADSSCCCQRRHPAVAEVAAVGPIMLPRAAPLPSYYGGS